MEKKNDWVKTLVIAIVAAVAVVATVVVITKVVKNKKKKKAALRNTIDESCVFDNDSCDFCEDDICCCKNAATADLAE